jgi:hypothetical protein
MKFAGHAENCLTGRELPLQSAPEALNGAMPKSVGRRGRVSLAAVLFDEHVVFSSSSLNVLSSAREVTIPTQLEDPRPAFAGDGNPLGREITPRNGAGR